MYKTPQLRTTFGSWDVKKVHAVVARSTFPSQNVQHTILGPLLEVAMSKKCTPLWREAHFQVKMYKPPHARTTFRSWDVEQVHAVVVRSTFRSQQCKKNAGYGTFGRSDVVSPGRCKGLLTLSKVSKTWRFCSSLKKMMAGMGHMQRIWQDACRVAGTVQETCSSELLGGQGADFLRWVAFWSIRSWGLLRWFCVTGAALRMIWHQFFVAGTAL